MDTDMQAPPGAPRYVAMTCRDSGDYRIAAESPYLQPVDYAVGEMARAITSQGSDLRVELWGPSESNTWCILDRRHYRGIGASHNAANAGVHTLTAREQREYDRRYQLLAAALNRSSVEATPTEIAVVAEHLSTDGARTVTSWLDAAGEGH
ncbi:hypothetical protein [Streptomyces sp. NBC_01455]|uniref:hypothetical protein n=1 Tax=Streptomyces sp. NBC_01455 TaxID=2903874 RepID=UPI002E2F9435|nr:hypothetical protein [Streptomyces sp. NBC_01455]